MDKRKIARFLLIALLFLPLRASSATAAQPVGSTFTYQGQLKQNGQPVNTACDFRFTLWDDNNDPDPGNQIGNDVFATINVVGGLFTTELDFGPFAFSGDNRWLEIEVCCPASCVPAFDVLAPRQPIQPVPYAMFAQVADRALSVDGIDGHSLDAIDGTPADAVFVNPDGRTELTKGGLLVFDDEGQGITLTSDALTFNEGTSEDTVYSYRAADDAHRFYTARGAMSLNADGNLAVGTHDPSFKLHAQGEDDPLAGPTLALEGKTPDQTNSGQIRFLENTGDLRGAFIKYHGGLNHLQMGIHRGPQSDPADDKIALSISQPANFIPLVNVGQNNQPANLNVWNQLGVVSTQQATNNVGSGSLFLQDANANRSLNLDYNSIEAVGSSFLDINAGNAAITRINDALWINTQGEVGIGTTSPDAPLHVAPTPPSDIAMQLDGILVAPNGLKVRSDVDPALDVVSPTTGASRFRINTDGAVESERGTWITVPSTGAWIDQVGTAAFGFYETLDNAMIITSGRSPTTIEASVKFHVPFTLPAVLYGTTARIGAIQVLVETNGEGQVFGVVAFTNDSREESGPVNQDLSEPTWVSIPLSNTVGLGSSSSLNLWIQAGWEAGVEVGLFTPAVKFYRARVLLLHDD